MSTRARAFTLVEMLVALAITAVLVVLLVNVVSATLAIWEQGRNQIDTFANARQVLGRIADEISGAIAAPAPRAVDFSENLTSIVAPSGTSPIPTKSENVFFVAPYPNVDSGDLCVIAYRHNNTAPYKLERGFIESHAACTGKTSASSTPSPTRYQSSLYPNSNTAWQWRTIATGVLEFEIQSYSQADLDSTASPSPTPAASWSSTSSTPLGSTPREVIVRIKVVDDRTLTKLNALTPSNPTYIRLVNRAARQFTASVMLPPSH
jgi:prepilin-type N-terminal cleavage/methylation domain-containing protein